MNAGIPTKQLIVINGPTGVGKTRTSIELAEKLDTHIISFDSRQFYRELTIGTAVPVKEDLSLVKHHFIQHISIQSYYSVFEYEKEALQLLNKLFTDHSHVVMTGGSGLYLDAVIQGIDDIPDPDPLIRLKLQERFEEEGLEQLLQELKELDPEYYNTVDKNNPKRVLRGLEVCISTGATFSSFRIRNTLARDFIVKHINLVLDRELLYERINTRVEQMMSMGLLEEVKALIPSRHLNALKTVGYRELFAYLDGEYDLKEAIRLIQRNTRHYARRQITWNRKYPFILETQPGNIKQIVKSIL